LDLVFIPKLVIFNPKPKHSNSFSVSLSLLYSLQKNKIKVADLKETVGYSTGGVYSAFESIYLTKENDEIHLTEEGKEYFEDRILPRFDVYKSYGNVLIMLGLFFFAQWFEWTSLNVAVIPPWYSALMILGAGVFLRVFVLRLSYFIMKRRKKMDYP
jgi:hypothetical protein